MSAFGEQFRGRLRLGERREVRGEGERSSYSLRSRNLNKSYYSSTLIFIATAPLVGAQTTANYAIAESYVTIDAPEAREARR